MNSMEMQEEIVRVRTPRKGEVLGQIVEMLGSSKMRVDCEDGNLRICRIPGSLKREIWVKLGDIVIVEPWKVQSNERGDIIWRYTRNQVIALKKQGFAQKFEV